jgi:hypothetical protein
MFSNVMRPILVVGVNSNLVTLPSAVSGSKYLLKKVRSLKLRTIALGLALDTFHNIDNQFSPV